MPQFSIIVPVYNRPDEIDELLSSLAKQTYKEFEIVIVEDGSKVPCKHIVDKYTSQLRIQYFFKENEKPAIARNFGMAKASGDYFLFFDSDCILPPQYMEIVVRELTEHYVDAYGGPDMAHPSFSRVQKAISFAMTSILTTGGIRGKSEKIDNFYPRSFNMGLSREIFRETGGFPVTKMHPGEDMVLSIEIIKRGYKTRLLKNASVFHKRRATLRQFFKQVYNFGKTRLIMSKIYPETFKIFYMFPTAFILGSLLLLVLSLWSIFAIIPIVVFMFAAFILSVMESRDPVIGGLSVISSFFQLAGYGLGFIIAAFNVYVLGKDEYGVFKSGFYKE